MTDVAAEVKVVAVVVANNWFQKDAAKSPKRLGCI